MVFRRVADALANPGPGGGGVEPEDLHVALVRVMQTQHHAEHRGLAGAVRTQQSGDAMADRPRTLLEAVASGIRAGAAAAGEPGQNPVVIG